MKKRILSLFLALLAVCALWVPAIASDEPSEEMPAAPADAPEQTAIGSGLCGDSVYWTLSNDYKLLINGSGRMYDYTSSPARVPWYNLLSQIKEIHVFGAQSQFTGVTHIGDNAFAGCSSVTNVIIGETVTSIGSDAFSGCSVRNLTLPSGLTSIGERAFENSHLLSISIPSSVTSIGENAFHNCTGLSGTVTVPSGVSAVRANTFSGCTALSSIVLSQGVAAIGDSAFEGCSGLVSFTVPASVTEVGEYAFRGCSHLESVTFAGSAPTIADHAFSGLTLKAAYPDGDATWTEDKCQQYGGTVTWPSTPTPTPSVTPTPTPSVTPTPTSPVTPTPPVSVNTPAPQDQGFVVENGKTYYYVNGVKQKTGLTPVGDKLYYFSVKDGHMMTSCLVNGGGGKYYYVAKDGHAMRGGWARGPHNRYYYCADNAQVIRDSIFTAKDGKIYCVDADGVRQSGFVLKDGNLYYFNPYDSGAAIAGKSFNATADANGVITVEY